MTDDYGKSLVGRKNITAYLGIGKNVYYELVKAGAPITKRSGVAVAHKDELDNWCRAEHGECQAKSSG